MTADELKSLLEEYAQRATEKITPRPRFTVTVDEMDDDGHKWLDSDVDFYFREGSPVEEKAAERAMEAITEIVQNDERMECVGEGFGDGQMGVTVTVEIEDEDSE